IQAEPSAQFQNLGTGGSFSVRGSWKTLRRAGATAREMLISAAAQKWSVDRNACRAEGNAVIHLPTGRRASYGELTAIAATLPLPTDVTLKSVQDFKIVGQPTKRI